MVWLGIVFVALIGGCSGFGSRQAMSSAGMCPSRSNVTLTCGAVRGRIIDGDATRLASFDSAFRAEPRTEVLAGSIDEGRITYISRTRFWGFPDYTTVELRDGKLYILSRLRFGASDLGVNRNRLERVLGRLP